MRMIAAVLYEQGLPAPYAASKPFRIEEVALDGPGEGEVLLEIRAAGLCHSDLSNVAGQRKRVLPAVGGHEGAGVVLEVGKNAGRKLKAGDHVVMSAVSFCGHCAPCSRGRPVLCETVAAPQKAGRLANGAIRLSRGGDPLFHYAGVSSFAQYAVTVPNALIRIDPTVPLEVAAMFGCAVTTGAGSVFNSARVQPGQTVAIIGLGGVGLTAVMAARIAGASEIIGIDLNEGKFALARELGCTRTISATDPDLVAAIRDATAGGVDFVFEISGSKAAMTTAHAITQRGGEIICIGLGPSNDMYQYAHATLVADEKVIRGSYMGGCNVERDIPRFIRMYQDGRLLIDRLMSGTMSFDILNEALDRLESGTVLRQILVPNG